MHFKDSLIFVSVLATAQASSSCDMNAWCKSKAGSQSYCKNWLNVSSCAGADQFKYCSTCGVIPGTASVDTTVTATPTTVATTTRAVTTTTPKPTTVATTTKTTTKAATTTTKANTTTTTKPVTTTRAATTSTTRATTTTTPVPTTTAPVPTSIAPATTASTATATISTSAAAPALPLPVTTVTADCEALPVYQTPLFLWVEMPNKRTRSDYVAFYQKLKQFLDSNCANIRVTTIVVRIVSPYFPSADPMYWPPQTSPLYTELIAKFSSSSQVKILLYPYVMEDGDRNNWVKFANSVGANPVIANGTNTVYDGIFAYTKQWQDFVGDSSVLIDGFMLDFEEIYKAMGTQNMITLTNASFSPYKAAYPTIKTATSVGFDDGKSIRNFDVFMDYIHLQVYDFFYPYAGADKSKTDSIFEVYKNDPAAFLNVVMTNVLTSAVLKAYQGRESKIKLMWSTQTLWNDCIYPMRDGTCGINYEFNWTPDRFNQFAQMVQSHPKLGAFEHGIYTYNFIHPSWLVKKSRE